MRCALLTILAIAWVVCFEPGRSCGDVPLATDRQLQSQAVSPNTAGSDEAGNELADGQPPQPCTGTEACASIACQQGITDLIVILDCSLSMACCTSETNGIPKFSIGQWAVYDLLDAIPEQFRMGLILMRPGSPGGRSLEPLGWSDKTQLRRTIMRLSPAGTTSIGDALQSAATMLGKAGDPSKAAIVVISDGERCNIGQGSAAAQSLQQVLHADLHVVGVAPSPNAAVWLSGLAASAGGTIYTVRAIGDLGQALEPITRRLQEVRNARFAEFECFKNGLYRCDTEVARLSARLARAIEERDEARDDLTQCRTDLAKTEEKLKCCQGEKQLLAARIDDLEEDLEESQDAGRHLHKQLAEIGDKLTTSEGSLAKTRTELTKTKEQLKCCRADVTALTSQVAGLKEDIKECTEEKHHLHHRLHESQEELAKVTDRLGKCTDDLSKSQEQLKCCGTEKAALTSQVSNLTQGLAKAAEVEQSLRQQLGSTAQALARVQDDLATCRTQLKCCDDKYCTAEKQLVLTETALHNCQRDKEELNLRLQTTLEKYHQDSLLQIAQQQAIASAQVLAAGKPNCCPAPGPSVVYGPYGPIVPTTSPGNSPIGGTPVAGGTPVGGTPVGGNPVGGNPVGGNPVGGTPVGGNPVGGNPVGGNPVGGTPVGGNPVGGNPVGGTPVGGNPVGGNPVGGNPVGGTPVAGSAVGGAAAGGGGAAAGGAPAGQSAGASGSDGSSGLGDVLGAGALALGLGLGIF